MTKEELMALLRDPGQTGQSVDELNRLIEENPYFHTGHQLYLKGLQQTNQQQMALQLGKTALSVRDRGVLYNYLNRPSSFRQQPPVSPDQPEQKETQAPFVPGNTFVSPEADIHNIQRTPEPEPSLPHQHLMTMGGWHHAEEQLSVDEKIMSSEELMNVIRRQLEEISSPQGEEESQPSAEIAANTVDAVTNAIEPVTDVVESATGAGEPATDAIEPAGNVVENAVEAGLPVPYGKPDVEIRDEYSEEQLLADLIRIAPIRDVVKTSPRDIVAKDDMQGDLTTAQEKQKLTSHKIVDTFLKSNPKIIPNDNHTFQVDLTESLQENQDIATETLADIYATQGHKNKAIEIYEHLILKYPEKHIYFAAQIERLKN